MSDPEITTLKFGPLEFKGFKKYLENIRQCFIVGQRPKYCGFGYHISDCDMRENGLCKLHNRVACGYAHL